MAKKTLLPARAVRQATLSSSQICKEEQKPNLLWKGDGMIIFSWINAQTIVFQLPNLKKLYCLGVEVTPAYQVIKKLKMNHLGLYMLNGLSHLTPQRLQSVIKNKGEMPVTELLNTSTRQSKKHILEISCKNEVLIQSIAHEIRGTNFQDTLYNIYLCNRLSDFASRLPFLLFSRTFYIQMSEPRVLILGHSFMRRLNSFITDSRPPSLNGMVQEVGQLKKLFAVSSTWWSRLLPYCDTKVGN